MFLAREGPVHDVADALFLARSVWEAGIRDVHRAEDHAEVGIDRPVSPVADFRNLRIRSAITSAPDDRLSFSSGLGSIPSGSLGLWFLRRPPKYGLIHLNRTFEGTTRLVGPRFTDTVQHEPCRRLGYLDVSVEFHTGYRLQASQADIDGNSPFPERHVGSGNRCPCADAEIVSAQSVHQYGIGFRLGTSPVLVLPQ